MRRTLKLFTGIVVFLLSSLTFAHYYFTVSIQNPTSTTTPAVLGSPTTTTTWYCVKVDGSVTGGPYATSALAETPCGTAVATDGVVRYLEERVTTSQSTTSTTSTRRIQVQGGTTIKVSDAQAQLLVVGGAKIPSSGGGGGTPSVNLSSIPAAGQWEANYGLNTIVDVKGPNPNSGTTIGGGEDNAYLTVYCGGLLNPLYGSTTLGSVVWGPCGGHASYDGNDFYSFDPVTRLISRVRSTYNNTAAGPNSFGEYPDGSPFPPHSWDSQDFLPIGTNGTLVMTWTYTSAADANQRTATSHLYNFATNTWTRGPSFNNPLHPSVAYDPARRVIWHYAEANGPLQRFDGTTVTAYSSNNYSIAANTVSTVDTRRDQFVHYSDNSSGTAGTLYVTNLNSPNTLATSISLNTGPGNDCAFVYVPERDRIFAWSGSGKTVYVLDPNNYAAGWTTEGSSSTQTPTTVNNFSNAGAQSKFQYVPAAASIIGVGGNGQKAQAYHITGISVADSEAADWAFRTSGTGVIWYHNFANASEVNAFRWVEAYGQDPGDTRDPGKCIWSSEGFGGGGSMKQIRLAGSTETQCNWWRPFAPLTGASNGRGADDPAANGTVTVRSMVAVQGQETIRNMGNFGYYGSATYSGQGGFDGTEIFIQARVKMPSARISGGNASVEGGKLFFLTNNRQAFSTQEIVTMSGFSDGGSPAKNAFQMYRQGGQSLPNDESPYLGFQPGGSVGIVGNGQANYADSTRANFWTWPGDKWTTILYHLVPGTSGGSNTKIEVWAAECGETNYRRVWSQSHANITFQGSGDATNGNSGYNALIFDTYVNGINMNPGFTNQVTQIIASKQWIPPPRYTDPAKCTGAVVEVPNWARGILKGANDDTFALVA